MSTILQRSSRTYTKSELTAPCYVYLQDILINRNSMITLPSSMSNRVGYGGNANKALPSQNQRTIMRAALLCTGYKLYNYADTLKPNISPDCSSCQHRDDPHGSMIRILTLNNWSLNKYWDVISALPRLYQVLVSNIISHSCPRQKLRIDTGTITWYLVATLS